MANNRFKNIAIFLLAISICAFSIPLDQSEKPSIKENEDTSSFKELNLELEKKEPGTFELEQNNLDMKTSNKMNLEEENGNSEVIKIEPKNMKIEETNEGKENINEQIKNSVDEQAIEIEISDSKRKEEGSSKIEDMEQNSEKIEEKEEPGTFELEQNNLDMKTSNKLTLEEENGNPEVIKIEPKNLDIEDTNEGKENIDEQIKNSVDEQAIEIDISDSESQEEDSSKIENMEQNSEKIEEKLKPNLSKEDDEHQNSEDNVENGEDQISASEFTAEENADNKDKEERNTRMKRQHQIPSFNPYGMSVKYEPLPSRNVYDGVAMHQETKNNVTNLFQKFNPNIQYDNNWEMDHVASRFSSCNFETGLYRTTNGYTNTYSTLVVLIKDSHAWPSAEMTIENLDRLLQSWWNDANWRNFFYRELPQAKVFGCSTQPRCQNTYFTDYHTFSCAFLIPSSPQPIPYTSTTQWPTTYQTATYRPTATWPTYTWTPRTFPWTIPPSTTSWRTWPTVWPITWYTTTTTTTTTTKTTTTTTTTPFTLPSRPTYTVSTSHGRAFTYQQRSSTIALFKKAYNPKFGIKWSLPLENLSGQNLTCRDTDPFLPVFNRLSYNYGHEIAEASLHGLTNTKGFFASHAHDGSTGGPLDYNLLKISQDYVKEMSGHGYVKVQIGCSVYPDCYYQIHPNHYVMTSCLIDFQ